MTEAYIERNEYECVLCPRRCRAKRYMGQTGFCGATSRKIYVARAALHMWEEPCISGVDGSGAVFFSGCTLRCSYCQNYDISMGKIGKAISVDRLSEIFLELQTKGACNINLVTPTHYSLEIIEAVDKAQKNGLKLPIVYNCSGYENVETLRLLENTVDIYLTDFKYMTPELAKKYSAALDYPEIAKDALKEMVRQKNLSFNETGLMKSGVIVRNLILPGFTAESKKILKYVHRQYGDSVYISIMNQYTPLQRMKGDEHLKRRVTKREYEKVLNYALELKIKNAFIQEGDTVGESFIPSFDYSGV